MSERPWSARLRRGGARKLEGPAGAGPTGPDEPFEITIDGLPVPARPGETIAAALLATGVRAWRTTRVDGRPRGLFCGIGICYDCLVSVDGQRVRACQRPAAPGDVVSTQAWGDEASAQPGGVASAQRPRGGARPATDHGRGG